jgi:hypothetical protein
MTGLFVGVFLNLDLYFEIDELKSMLTSGGAEILRNLDSMNTRQVLSFSIGIAYNRCYGSGSGWFVSPGTGSKFGMQFQIRIDDQGNGPKLLNKPEFQ